MNRKTTLIALVLLLVGAVAIAIVNSKKEEDGENEAKNQNKSKPGSERVVPGGEAENSSKGANRNPEEQKDGELVAQYGGARTALSRKVAGDVVVLFEDVLAMGEMMAEGAANFGGRQRMMQGAISQMGIELTEEQQEKASALFEAYQKRQMEKTRSAVGGLKKDSSALMELFLAGDAKERGEITEDEYAAIQRNAGEDLVGVLNPLDQKNFRGGQPLEDDELVGDFKEILDEDQNATFATFLDDRQAEAAAAPEPDGNISNMPTMELEELDQKVGAASKVASGFRTVLEGFGGLQEQ